MADFKPALARTLAEEGGYSNDPLDKGGETYRGISRNNWPKWKGWKEIDSWKKKTDVPNQPNSLILDPLVEDFYRHNFWQPLRADEIQSQPVAEAIFDTAVVCGVKRAVMFAQEVLEEWQTALCLFNYAVMKNDMLIRSWPARLVVDGIMGVKTITMLNLRTTLSDGEYSFLAAYIERRRQHHFEKVTEDPTQNHFLNGWLARTERFALSKGEIV